jgi:hypothetical protein
MIAYRSLVTTAALLATASVVPLMPASALAATSAHAKTLCVGHQAGCYSTVAAAVKKAHDGDTIKIGKGRFKGGFTITTSVHLVGSGEKATRIVGGGPVVTIKSRKGKAHPTVTIRSLTIRGGRAISKGYTSTGAGIDIEPAPGNPASPAPGATVTLGNVTVTDNVASDRKTSPSPSGQKCPKGDCPFAIALGAGIFNGGNLTLVHSTVSDNRLVGPLSDADGGGIYSLVGKLTLMSSAVTGNKTEPTRIARFAEGGGIFVNTGSLVVEHSSVSHNQAKLVTHWPSKAQGTLIDMNANSGGIHMGDGGRARVVDSTISHNLVLVRDDKGEPAAFDSAMLVGNSHLSMSGTTVSDNTEKAFVATTADVGPSGTALEIDARAAVTNSRIVDNASTTTSPHGAAAASSGVAVFDFFNDPRQVTFTHDTISGNTATSITKNGTASVTGAGVLNNSLLRLVDSVVRGNTGTVDGGSSSSPGGPPTAQGGGIWNGPLLSGPPVTLVLDHTSVTGNSVTGPTGATLEGGGIYTTLAIARTHSPVTHNHPDNCHGCSS